MSNIRPEPPFRKKVRLLKADGEPVFESDVEDDSKYIEASRELDRLRHERQAHDAETEHRVLGSSVALHQEEEAAVTSAAREARERRVERLETEWREIYEELQLAHSEVVHAQALCEILLREQRIGADLVEKPPPSQSAIQSRQSIRLQAKARKLKASATRLHLHAAEHLTPLLPVQRRFFADALVLRQHWRLAPPPVRPRTSDSLAVTSNEKERSVATELVEQKLCVDFMPCLPDLAPSVALSYFRPAERARLFQTHDGDASVEFEARRYKAMGYVLCLYIDGAHVASISPVMLSDVEELSEALISRQGAQYCDAMLARARCSAYLEALVAQLHRDTVAANEDLAWHTVDGHVALWLSGNSETDTHLFEFRYVDETELQASGSKSTLRRSGEQPPGFCARPVHDENARLDVLNHIPRGFIAKLFRGIEAHASAHHVCCPSVSIFCDGEQQELQNVPRFTNSSEFARFVAGDRFLPQTVVPDSKKEDALAGAVKLGKYTAVSFKPSLLDVTVSLCATELLYNSLRTGFARLRAAVPSLEIEWLDVQDQFRRICVISVQSSFEVQLSMYNGKMESISGSCDVDLTLYGWRDVLLHIIELHRHSLLRSVVSRPPERTVALALLSEFDLLRVKVSVNRS